MIIINTINNSACHAKYFLESLFLRYVTFLNYSLSDNNYNIMHFRLTYSEPCGSLTSGQNTTSNSQSDMCDQQYHEEEKLMRRAIATHIPKLWQIYNQYANVACLKAFPFKSWMMRICLWQMYQDFKLSKKGISLIDIDKMLSDRICFDNHSIHYPFEVIYFWQYLHSLIRVAWELYGNELTSCMENNANGFLESAFLKFLENDVFPNCGQHTGSSLRHKKLFLFHLDNYLLPIFR